MVRERLSRPQDVGGEERGGLMKPESKRATAAAVAPLKAPMALYHGTPRCATAINDVLARLLFAFERTTVINVLDDLIRLKIDAGLLMEGQRP